MAGRPWTPQELEILKKMAEAGKTAKEIKKVLVTRSMGGITNKASSVGLSLAGLEPTINFEAYKEMMKGMEIKCL